MTNSKSAAAVFLLLLNLAVSEGEDDSCAAIEVLGTPNLDRFDYSATVDVDDDCRYTLKIFFKHDETLPVPSDPAAQCDPSVAPPEMASDGLPYFASRWYYQEIPDDMKAITGIDHVSIDWNPCGHPPVEVFGSPHYDLHLYRASPEYRSCMTCATPPFAPACLGPEAQTTESGLAYFNVSKVEDTLDQVSQRSSDPMGLLNMPPGFEVDMTAFVQFMGGHAWNRETEPASNLDWFDPVFIVGPYNGDIVHLEPMIPMAFVIGDIDKKHTESLTYQGQTLTDLPSSYSVEYSGDTKVVTVTLTGSSSVDCEEKTDESPPSTFEDSGAVLKRVSAVFLALFIVTAALF